jgi:hypothetical protein
MKKEECEKMKKEVERMKEVVGWRKKEKKVRG